MPFRNHISSVRPLSPSALPNANISSATSSRPDKRILLLLDWDGTLTPHSTLPQISRIRPQTSAPIAPTDNPLAPYTEAYMRDYRAYKTAHPPLKDEPTALSEELAHLNGLRSVEAASITRLENGGLWAGVRREDVEVAAVREQGLELRPGAKELVEKVWADGGLVAVVSVSWSARWIAGVLSAKGVDAVPVLDGLEGLDGGQVSRAGIRVLVFANEIAEDGSGRLSRGLPTSKEGLAWSGKEERSGVWTAGEKLEVMQDLVSRLAQPREEWITVYAGDSATDLACLAEADIGVMVGGQHEGGEQAGLSKVLARLGWSLDTRETTSQTDTVISKQRTIWQAEDFIRLSRLLLESN